MRIESVKAIYLSMKQSLFAFFLISIWFLGCKNNTELTPKEDSETLRSSFGLIQDQILTPTCATAGCHASESDASYKQHGLVLAKGKSYKNLFNQNPKNQTALADKIKLITAFKSAESLLFHKLNWTNNHHGGKNYGSPMPLGSNALYIGQIEFVRRWIEAGAPEKGEVVDESLLADKTPSVIDDADFTALAAPPAGQGYQLKVDKFDIAPNFERELFVRKEIGNKQDIYVNKIQLKSRQNSHHMVIYDFRNKNIAPRMNTLRDLRNPDNTLNFETVLSMSNHTFLAGGTDSQQEYVFPEGTALLLPANASVDLNPHYFNRTNQVRYGENYVNFFTIEPQKVKNVVKMLDLGNQSISIEPNQRKTFTKTWTFAENRNIVMLTSHMHELGEKFVIKIKGGKRDGEVIYETTDWEHPLIFNFKEPLQLNKDEGITSEITYFNNTNKLVKFGLTSADEMGIIFGYYYERK